MSRAKENSQFLLYVLSSLDVRGLPFFVNLFSKLYVTLFFSGLLSYFVGINRRTRRRVVCKRDNSHFFRYVLISPEAEIFCRP